jgi:hypothetical protein
MIDANDELLTLGQALVLIGGSKRPINAATFYRQISKGRFHKPYKPTPGISRWSKRRLLQEMMQASPEYIPPIDATGAR